MANQQIVRQHSIFAVLVFRLAVLVALAYGCAWGFDNYVFPTASPSIRLQAVEIQQGAHERLVDVARETGAQVW